MAFKSTLLFDVLGNILTTKSRNIYNQHVKSDNFKDVSKFILLRYLTMSPSSVVRQLVINNYIELERMPERALYKWLLVNIPKQSSSFIRFIK